MKASLEWMLTECDCYALDVFQNIRIHHGCPCRTGKFHLRGRNFNQGWGLLIEIPIPRVRFPYHAGTGSWWILFLSVLSGLFLGPAWSCEVEVSHLGKKPISYRQRWEKVVSHLLSFQQCLEKRIIFFKASICNKPIDLLETFCPPWKHIFRFLVLLDKTVILNFDPEVRLFCYLNPDSRGHHCSETLSLEYFVFRKGCYSFCLFIL